MIESELRTKVANGSRISCDEGKWLVEYADDALISELATLARNRFHRPDEATYLIMAIVNYTNICVAMCDYCAFYRLPHQEGGYHLSFKQVVERIEKLLSYGGTLVGFNGGFNPKLSLNDFAEFFGKIKVRFPGVVFYDMTVAEFMFYCKRARLNYQDGALKMKASGVEWITGGGSEILADTFRERHSPGKYKVDDYFAAQQAIVDADMGSTATMVIGFDESLDERFEHLERLRHFQDECLERTRPLTSFLCWTYKPWNNKLGGKEIGNREYLRWLGISRIFLDNFKHVRTSVLTQNEGALDGLLFGANDFDLPTEDEVTQKAGASISLQFEDILDHARRLGFKTTHREPWDTSQPELLDQYASRQVIKPPIEEACSNAGLNP